MFSVCTLCLLMTIWDPSSVIDPVELGREHSQEIINSPEFRNWVGLAVGGSAGGVLIRGLVR